jgi:hypothetical protein
MYCIINQVLEMRTVSITNPLLPSQLPKKNCKKMNAQGQPFSQQDEHRDDDKYVNKAQGITGLFYTNNEFLKPQRVTQWFSTHTQALPQNDWEKEAKEFDEFVEMLKQSNHPSTIPHAYPSSTSMISNEHLPSTNTSHTFHPSAPRMLQNVDSNEVLPPAHEQFTDQQFMEQYELFKRYKAFENEKMETEQMEKRKTELLQLRERLQFSLNTYETCYKRCIGDYKAHSFSVKQQINKFFDPLHPERSLDRSQIDCLQDCVSREWEFNEMMKDKFLDKFLNEDWDYAQLAAKIYTAIHNPNNDNDNYAANIIGMIPTSIDLINR